MITNRHSDGDPAPGPAAKAIHDHWILFARRSGPHFVGASGDRHSVNRQCERDRRSGMALSRQRSHRFGDNLLGATGTRIWWSLVSALLAIVVGIVLIASKSQDLYGGLMGWPFEDVGPLRLILVLFFLVEGGASIMFAFEHRRQFSGRWAWMLASGVVDIVLASIIIFDLPGTSAWTMGLLVGINLILGGVALTAMGLHARTEWPAAN